MKESRAACVWLVGVTNSAAKGTADHINYNECVPPKLAPVWGKRIQRDPDQNADDLGAACLRSFAMG